MQAGYIAAAANRLGHHMINLDIGVIGTVKYEPTERTGERNLIDSTQVYVSLDNVLPCRLIKRAAQQAPYTTADD